MRGCGLWFCLCCWVGRYILERLPILIMLPAIIGCTALFCLLTGLPQQEWAHSDSSMFSAPAAVHHQDDEETEAEPAKLYPAKVSIDPCYMVSVVIKINSRMANLRNVYVGKRVSRGEVLGDRKRRTGDSAGYL